MMTEDCFAGGSIEGSFVALSEYKRLESLLLDARAELAAKDEAYRLQFEACASMNGKLERAEALAGEYERDALRYRIWRDRSNPLTDALRIEAADLYGDDLDAAIDAVGGRGE